MCVPYLLTHQPLHSVLGVHVHVFQTMYLNMVFNDVAKFVVQVTAGSIASRELSTGDLLLRIGHEDTGHLTQSQANDVIKHCGNVLQLCVSK